MYVLYRRQSDYIKHNLDHVASLLETLQGLLNSLRVKSMSLHDLAHSLALGHSVQSHVLLIVPGYLFCLNLSTTDTPWFTYLSV